MYYVTKKIILLRWQKEKLEFVSCVMMVKFYAFYPSIKGFAFNIYGLIKNYSIRPTSQVGTYYMIGAYF